MRETRDTRVFSQCRRYEAQGEALVNTPARRWWECPCGTELAKRADGATPTRTIVSLREPRCPFCGGGYRDEFRVTEPNVNVAADEAAKEARP
jgi:hypothetical protein